MLNHLIELRKRALMVILFFAGLFFLFFFYANPLFQIVVTPLIQALPSGNTLIATQIASPVLTPVKLAADAALLGAMPFALIQIWLFVAPGLYRDERRILTGAMIMSLLLFCAGLLFCFYVVLPFMFQFFARAVPAGVKLMPDIAGAMGFITNMLILFGLCFQVPLLCMAAVRLHWIELSVLKQIRPYVIVGSFTAGMLLTPPDVFSQIMLAVPLCLLYELGLLLAAWQSRTLARQAP
ncbi:twin-arginine translocase subunit TatC [Legionella spiritensis]|uniref:Sec-independent protein translocase protein TatC n=1 Tax=Legionella spiritensis TaxID=452 RepID=A0A0W0ZB45_LEGSP|nr:twin-arginine translocase subunit TatC [Legionella spiritensis]KTD66327.1 sec-independent (periplasmic) protein translocase protein TatC [Legionella spiritensis]SNV48656.1 sec-independent (periplasmic) protein translocase protein TatC [Legionella spiritensis]